MQKDKNKKMFNSVIYYLIYYTKINIILVDMKIEQTIWTDKQGWYPKIPGNLVDSPQLVLVFGSSSNISNNNHLNIIKKAYPDSQILGCSTAGEIIDDRVIDDSLTTTAIHFENTDVKSVRIKIKDAGESYKAGKYLSKSLNKKGLVHIFVVSEGININGSELVRGLTDSLPEHITVTGGLSGDGENFKKTCILWNNVVEENSIAAIGLYSTRLRVGYASMGGWDPFGPERLITRSKENVLYELDNKSALQLYKKYLGEHAKGLPATGLLFPLSIRETEDKKGVVRTILSVDEKNQSMTFAGDVPEGSYARLMKANFNRLIDGASGAAKTSYESIGSEPPDLAILISCVGRKMVLKQRIDEEVEAVRDILGNKAVFTGFYSYGEISPFTLDAKCELHNQTMTITTLSEKI